MTSIFLLAALALPSAVPYHAMTPTWNFQKEEVEIIRMLRDYENGDTASRPHKLVIIYGQHPNWVRSLHQAHIRTLGVWKEKTHWPHYIQAHPHYIPRLIFEAQVYIFDGIEQLYQPPEFIVTEASRLVSYWGFFLFRPALCQEIPGWLYKFHWRRFRFDFHDFQIWWRNEGLRREDAPGVRSA